MTCYLLPIGGTGVRVMKSIVHLCMAGCFDTNVKFKVMCVDSDEVNGDVKELQKLIKEYNSVPNDMFPEIRLPKIDGEEKCVWSPLSEEGLSTRSPMKTMVSESTMGKNAKDILHFLYTDEELNKVLEGGFYGHTSIGSYFMAQQVTSDGCYTDAWNDFFDGIGEEDRIFIIGSVFGGTGASGVPTIARLIKENDNTKDKSIGAIFVMPYFKPVNKDDEISELPIDWNTFTTKAKTALSFYQNQQFDKIFDMMYFIGEDSENFMNVENNDCGVAQRNKANPIEVFAASALVDFLEEKTPEKFTTKFLTKEKLADGTKPLTQQMLNEIAGRNCFEKIEKFLKFSIIYTRYMFYCLKERDANEKWYEFYEKVSLPDAEDLKRICISYIEWIKELVIMNDSKGAPDYSCENNDLKWFWFKQYADLYSDTELSYDEKGLFKKHKEYKLHELDNLSLIVKDTSHEENKSGKDIIVEFSNYVAPKSRKNDENNSSDLKRLIADVISLL